MTYVERFKFGLKSENSNDKFVSTHVLPYILESKPHLNLIHTQFLAIS